MGVIFFALIISATYTASLAAYLSRTRFTLAGPQSVAELRNSRVCAVSSQLNDQGQLSDQLISAFSSALRAGQLHDQPTVQDSLKTPGIEYLSTLSDRISSAITLSDQNQ